MWNTPLGVTLALPWSRAINHKNHEALKAWMHYKVVNGRLWPEYGYYRIIYKRHMKWSVSKGLYYLLHGEISESKTSIYWFTSSLSKSIKVKLKPLEPTLTQILCFNTGSHHPLFLYFIKFLQNLVIKTEFQEKEVSVLWGVYWTNIVCHLLASATRFKYCLIGAIQTFTVISETSAVTPFQIIFTFVTSLYFCL